MGGAGDCCSACMRIWMRICRPASSVSPWPRSDWAGSASGLRTSVATVVRYAGPVAGSGTIHCAGDRLQPDFLPAHRAGRIGTQDHGDPPPGTHVVVDRRAAVCLLLADVPGHLGAQHQRQPVPAPARLGRAGTSLAPLFARRADADRGPPGPERGCARPRAGLDEPRAGITGSGRRRSDASARAYAQPARRHESGSGPGRIQCVALQPLPLVRCRWRASAGHSAHQGSAGRDGARPGPGGSAPAAASPPPC